MGIRIPTRLADLYNLNFAPLLLSIRKETQVWDKPRLSWFGMTILPKALYLFKTIPLRLPATFFTTIRQCFCSFLWKRKTARISLKCLSLPKNKGWHVVKYHWACLLTQIVDWNIHGGGKNWVSIAQGQMNNSLWLLPWIQPQA